MHVCVCTRACVRINDVWEASTHNMYTHALFLRWLQACKHGQHATVDLPPTLPQHIVPLPNLLRDASCACKQLPGQHVLVLACSIHRLHPPQCRGCLFPTRTFVDIAPKPASICGVSTSPCPCALPLSACALSAPASIGDDTRACCCCSCDISPASSPSAVPLTPAASRPSSAAAEPSPGAERRKLAGRVGPPIRALPNGSAPPLLFAPLLSAPLLVRATRIKEPSEERMPVADCLPDSRPGLSVGVANELAKRRGPLPSMLRWRPRASVSVRSVSTRIVWTGSQHAQVEAARKPICE